jgi:hypothetical protein
MTIDEIEAELKKIKSIEIYPDKKENGDMTLFLVCLKIDYENIYDILLKNKFTVSDFKNLNNNYTITLSFIDLKFDYAYNTKRTNENYQYFGFLEQNQVHFINTAYIDGNIFRFDRENRIKIIISTG